MVAFTFPGQGSQFPGMGKVLFEEFSQARLVFEEVDDALGQKLSQIMFEGPEETLQLTANAQPALMTYSIALLRVMISQGLDLQQHVNYVAGHSLGEYSALCGAGMFNLADAARLLRLRGNAMQEAVPVGKGAMAAIIGLPEALVQDICQEASQSGVCQIANDNGAGQLVISGEKGAVEFAIAQAQLNGAKRALLLPVSAPFHSVLMAPAAEAMKEALKGVEKHNPVVPLIANVTVEPEQDSARISGLLVEQVTGRVRWRETVEWFSHNDDQIIFEIGAGKVLTGLARRIDKNIKAVNVSTLQDIEDALKLLNI